MDFGKVLFSLQGRMGQQDYWIGVLIIIGAQIVGSLFLGPLMPLLWFALIWVGIAVYGKRLHDAGRSAWIHLIPWAIWLVLLIICFSVVGAAIVGFVVGLDGAEPSASDAFGLVGTLGAGLAILGLSYVVWMVYTVWVGLLPSEDHDNVYGPVPGGDGATSANTGAAAASVGAPLASEGTSADEAPKS